MSLTKLITEHINTTLPNPQNWSPTMAQKYQQIEINKEEFKNLVTRKIDNVHELSGNKLQL